MPKITEKYKGDAVNLAFDTIKKKKQALIFVNTKKSAEKTAEDIAKHVPDTTPQLSELSESVLHALPRPTKQCERLARCVKKGIAYHHAGLVHSQRELIEDNFRSGTLKIICCTPTLAYGLDLPAYRSIIKDSRRYGGRWGMQWIPTLEYLQMAGRAGRPKFDNVGEAISIAATDEEYDKIYERYITGEPEEIYSKLAVEPVLRTYILSLIATGFVTSKKGLFTFFKKTFWASQYKDIDKLESIMIKMLDFLETCTFIKAQRDDFVSADKVSDEKITATMLGKRVSQLYLDPLTAHHILTCFRRTKTTHVTIFSLLQMISHTLEMRPLLRVKTKEWDDIQQALVQESFLDLEPSMYEPEYESFINSVKTALFLQEWCQEKDEEYLLEKYTIRPGEIKVKLDRADWLLYASYELAKATKHKKLLTDITKLRFRLKYGVKEELLPLLKLKGIGRVRARKLFRNKVKDVSDIKKIDLSKLKTILGQKTAIDIKRQVDGEIKEIPKRARKGQLSLNKF